MCVTEAIIKWQLKALTDPNVTPKVKYWYSRIVPPGQSSESILLETTPACLWTHDNPQFRLLFPNINFGNKLGNYLICAHFQQCIKTSVTF